MKKLIAAAAAAGVLVAGAFVASTVTTNPADAQVPDTVTEQAVTEQQERPDRGEVFDEVMAGLVADGTIDQGQSDAIKDAFEAKRDEIEEEFGPRPDRSRGFHRGALRGLLADDVITQAEIDALPDDHPLRTGESPLSELLEDDGQITREELEVFKDEHRPEAPERDDPEQGGLSG